MASSTSRKDIINPHTFQGGRTSGIGEAALLCSNIATRIGRMHSAVAIPDMLLTPRMMLQVEGCMLEVP